MSAFSSHASELKYNSNNTIYAKKLTLISRAKQRWRLMSLLKSLGRSRIKLSSSTPLVSCHLYCSYRLIRSLRLSGSNRWDIHCSASLLFTLISSNLVVVDCKYVCFKTSAISHIFWIYPKRPTFYTEILNEIKIFRTNLHISNEEWKQYQTRDRNENCKVYFPNIGTCLQVLAKRTETKKPSRGPQMRGDGTITDVRKYTSNMIS